MKLDDATKIYLGSSEITKIYAGAVQKWTNIPPVLSPVIIQTTSTESTLYGSTSLSSSSSINDVVVGNTLLFVALIENEQDRFNHELSDPVGSTWTKVFENVLPAWNTDRIGICVYIAQNVAAGTHNFTLSNYHNGLIGVLILEVQNVSAVVASGSSGVAQDSGVILVNMTATTSGNVSAGETLLIGAGLFTASDAAAGSITGDATFTDRLNGSGQYVKAKAQTKIVTSPGGSTATWSAERIAGGSNMKGWVSSIIALQ